MPAEPAPLLTSGQRKLVGFALSFAAIFGSFALVALSLYLFGRFLGEFSGAFWPIATAGILALILRPVVRIFVQRFKLRRLTAVVLLYGLVILLVTGLLLAVLPKLISQIVDFFAYLPTLWANTVAWGEQHFPEWNKQIRSYTDSPTVKNAVDALAKQAQDMLTHLIPTLKSAGAGLFGVFGFIASMAIVPVYLFFFLLSNNDDPTKSLPQHLTFLSPEHRNDITFLVREFIGIIVAFFRGQLLIGCIMGVLLALGFTIAGLKFGLALGLIVGLINIVPYLGSILGLSVVLPLALFQPDGGGAGLMGACLGIFIGVQAIEGWLLTPRIMGKQTGLHPVAIIFAVFFWGEAFNGILGMLLAVPLTAFVVIAWRLLRHKYFGREQSGT